MTKSIWSLLKLSPAIVAATFCVANSAMASEQVTSVDQLTQAQEASNEIGQVTSVSQFSDVQPTDWAFQALQSLVERYGCIAGYPDSTYRGNRALTRYEFAAGLNACLDRVNELIATATADLVTKQDLATLQRLQEEFSAELATLRGRVDQLEARTAKLEAQQFSTTTKLKGEVIFNVSQAFGEDAAVGSRTLINNPNAPKTKLDSNTIFSDRVRLNLNSSFTGKDLLNLRLQSRNTFNYGGAATAGGTGTNMARLSFDGNEENDTYIDKINYAFNLTDAVRVKIDANNGELYGNVNNFNPEFASDAQGSISRFGRFSPIYRQGQAGAGATVTFNPKGPLSVSAAYLAGNRNSTPNANGASNPADKAGLFDGNFAAMAQVDYKFSDALGLGLTYVRSYQNTATGTVALFEGTGSNLANQPFGNVATSANHYGVQATLRPSSKITFAGWAGLSNAEARTGANEGAEADMFYWGTTLGIRDFGAKGNLLGLIFGQSPKVTGSDVRVANVEQKDKDTSYHLEALYRMQVNNNIAVTPGLMVIFNPEHNSNNDTIYVGTVRTTFSF